MRPRILTRLVEELMAGSHGPEAEVAAADLRVRVDGDRATITRDPSEPMTIHQALRAGLRVEDVHLAPDVYGRVRGRHARVGLLRRARHLARRHVVVDVVVDDGPSRAGRLVVDGPRVVAGRIAKLVGATSPLPEPGDRFSAGDYAHHFFDEEPLFMEATAADLAPVSRAGRTFVLAPGRVDDRAPPFALEVGRVLAAAALAERARRGASPEAAVRAMRLCGRRRRARGPVARARLRRAIGWVDALFPDGGNCYRRTLLELALDAAAARETLVFGLDVGRTGHVAFAGREDRDFDVAFELAP